MDTFSTGTLHANGLRFHFLEQGQGPLALCMHGFPDSPWTYRYLLPTLANAGYRVVAPFIRGYAPTAIPTDEQYTTQNLVADVNALHTALGGGSDAVLIAHDWSAVAAYGALAAEPTRWRRAVIGNVPPLSIFGQVAFTYAQIKRSFYFWFFQMAVSDSVVAANDLAFIDGLWGDWSPGYDATYDLTRLKECLRHPDNLKAAMGYYRALFNPSSFGLPEAMATQASIWGRPVPHPVLYIHGTTDGCIALDADLMQEVPKFLGPGSELARIEGVGHFFLVEKPQEINERIVRFLGSR
ncbi:MAG: alpha/beta fold hydrolase [Candidatus Binatia bacterium]